MTSRAWVREPRTPILFRTHGATAERLRAEARELDISVNRVVAQLVDEALRARDAKARERETVTS